MTEEINSKTYCTYLVAVSLTVLGIGSGVTSEVSHLTTHNTVANIETHSEADVTLLGDPQDQLKQVCDHSSKETSSLFAPSKSENFL